MSLKLKFFIALFLVLAPHVRAADTLCPDVDEARRTMPGDVAGVQADIDRLNLCVERARLLKQLDDIAQARGETLKKITASPDSFSSQSSPNMGGIPAMPMAALPELPQGKSIEGKPIEVRPGEVKIQKAAPNPLGDAPKTPEAKPGGSWKLRKIWGQGATMHAQLSDNSGILLNVIKGDPLPDGAVVENLSVKGVTISQNGKISDLPWDDMSSVKKTNETGK
ncbi:MAG: hypothetical protein JWM96_1365 [Alphaproteobacteria bacterium]|nr:hypothetical protein [Alphaproteobacteria bacterium]